MSVVSYDSSRLIPAPQVAITKTFNKSGDGTIIGNTYQLVLTGDIIAYKGSPNSSRIFWTATGYPPDEAESADSRLGCLLRKEEAIRTLFSAQGRELYIQSADASEPMKCNPRIVDITFAAGIWVDRVSYTITLEADKIYPIVENTFTAQISEASESWNIETDETPESLTQPRTYRMTHSVNATGKLYYDELGNTVAAWTNARAYVVPLLGFNSAFLTSSGVRDLPNTHIGYNHVRGENIDVKAGSYGVTETWLLASGPALEDFTIQTTSSAESNRQNVKINGTVTGLELRDSSMTVSSTKYTNAAAKFASVSGAMLGRCQTYSGYTDLNLYPLSESIGTNPITGIISYDYEYDNRPYNLIPGAIAEKITITDVLPNELVAIIPVLGRTAGPVLQPINTTQETTRTLNIEFVLRSKVDFTSLATAFNDTKPTAAATTIRDAADPEAAGYDEVYIQSDRETWEPITGRYSRETTWVYQ